MLLLKNGFVLNIETGKFVKRDMYIENFQIKKIAPKLQMKNVPQVDCTNKWLIPGLIDMHVHIKKHFANYFTAAGVTTVRNTAGSVIELRPFMNAEGNEPEPRVISADRMIDGPPGLWGEDSPYNINADNKSLAKAEVERQVSLGADFIKTYGWLEPEIMQTVIDEAKKYGKEVSTDILYSKKLNAIDVANMGMDWLEHASGIVQAMYPEWTMFAERELWDAIDWENPDSDKIEVICQQLLEKNVKLCPTIVLYDQMRLAENYWKVNHEIIQHIENSYLFFANWQEKATEKLGQSTFGIQTKMIQKIAYTYFNMGGVVVPGTDTPAGNFSYPGFALHRELQLFVEAGFTPLEALQQATMNASKQLKLDNLGMLKESYIADIVILNANPLEQIENTMEIDSVIKGGKHYTIEELLSQIPSEEEMNVYTNELQEQFKELQLMAE
jgi:hypothetical protein